MFEDALDEEMGAWFDQLSARRAEAPPRATETIQRQSGSVTFDTIEAAQTFEVELRSGNSNAQPIQ